MNKTFIKYMILFLFAGFQAQKAQAQLPVSLYYLENIPQSNLLNPAMVPRANGFVGVPLINGIYTNISTDISPGTFYQNGLLPINEGFDYSKLYSALGKTTDVSSYQTISPIIMGWRGKHGYFTLAISEKIQQNLALPTDIFKLVENMGIPAGTTLDLSTLNINTSYHREVSVGYTYRVNKELRIGVHAKALFGLANMSTKINQFTLSADKEEWRYSMDVEANASIPADIALNEDGMLSEIGLPELSADYLIDNVGLKLSNPGFGADFGATYDLDDKWLFSASVTDLGFINWKSDLVNLKSTGEYTFEGIEIDGLSSSAFEGIFEDLTDTLMNVVQFSVDSTQSYITYTTPKIYAGGAYKVNHYLTMGVLSKSILRKNAFHQEFNFSANLNLYRFFSAALSYNLSLKGYNSAGIALSFRGGPVQLYLVGDYVPLSYNNYIIQSDGDSQTIPGPTDFQNFSFMFGLNLIFGANGYQNEPIIDSYSEF